jgi:gliding motility-associated-like protein
LAVTAGVQYIIVISTNTAPQTVGYTLTLQTLNCAPPTNLSAVATGETGGVYSANLSWGNATNATSWQVFVQTSGSAMPTTAGTTTTTNTNFSVNSLTATGAPLGLGQYQYWVRAQCPDGTFSPWAGPFVFNTTTCSTGCNYQFVMTDSFGDGWNGNTMNVIQNGVTVATIGSTFTAGAGPVIISVPLCPGNFQLFWNSGGTFANEVAISIVNPFGQTIYTKAAGTGTQNSLLFTGTVDCLSPLCLPPTNLTVSNITANGATLNWTPNGPLPVSWEIFAVPTGSPAPTAGTAPTATTTTLPFTITGLLADTAYTYYVRAVCAGGGSNPWSSPSASFTTLPTCPRPTALTVTNISQTSASVGWVTAGTEASWQVLVLPAGSPAPTPATTGWVAAATNPFVVTGLTAGTSYVYYVRAVCSASDISTWSGPRAFNTTLCAPANQCLYSFVMTDSFGDGWNGNTMNIVQNGIVVATIGSTFTAGSGPITIQVPLCNGVPFSLVWNTGGTFATEVGVSITSFLGANLFTHTPGSNLQGQTLYTGQTVCTPPTCPQPNNLVVVGSGTENATLAWNEIGSATQWAIYTQPVGGPPPTGTDQGTVVNATTYTTPGVLQPGFYEFYVQAICSGSDTSFWSGPLQFFISAQGPVCAGVNIQIQTSTPGVVDLCPGDNCIELAATFTASGSTSTYNVQPVPFAPPFPFTGGTQVSVNIDDIWSSPIVLPFNFCFFGTNYNQIQVGSNGVLTFNNVPAPGNCPWAFTQTIPNTAFPIRNAIYGVYQDINPAVSTAPIPSNINYQILGTAPCRTFVVNYFNIAQYSCGTSVGLQTSQIVLYETSNMVDVYIQSRTPCTTWNSGSGVVGIQNAAGTQAHVPPGRNTGPWTATNEAWRFVPAGPSNVSFSWLQNGEFYSNSPTINVCVDQTTNMTAQAIYTGCGGTQTIRQENVLLQLSEIDVEPIEDVSACASYILPELTIGAYYTEPGGQGAQLFVGDEITETTTLYVYATAQGNTACTDEESFTVTIGNLEVEAPASETVCDSYVLPELTLGNYFTQPGGGGQPLTAGDVIATSQTIYVYAEEGVCTGENSFEVTVVPTPVLDPVSDVTACESYLLPALTAGNYYTQPDGQGTILNEGDAITSNQTIYIYQSNGDCTAEASFTVSIGSLTVTTPGDQTVCDSYTLPSLAVGNYFTSPAGTGTQYNAGELITSSQLIYVYAADGTCSAQESFTVTVNQTPVLAPVANITACNSYTLPALSTGNYYSGPAGTGVQYNAGDVINANQTIYVYAQTGTTPNCSAEASFTVSIGSLTVTTPGNQTVCDSYTLPSLAVGNYFTSTDGTGTQYNAGDVITSSQLIYVYAADGTCSAQESFTVTVNQTPVLAPVANITACNAYTLPALSTGNYFSGPAGTGVQYNAGDVITANQTIYVYAQTGTTPNCSSEASFTVSLQTLTVTAPASVTVCDNYTLPALASGGYFTSPNGVGPLAVGSVVTQTQTIYVFENNGVCSAEASFIVTVNQTPVLGTFSNITACGSYTLPVLVSGSYYSAPGASGTQYVGGQQITASQTIYVYAQTGTTPNCTAETSFEVTIDSAPVVDPVQNVVACDSFTLEPIIGEGSYYTGPGGTGTQLFAGTVITTTQTIYVYAQTGACSAEESFTVTVGQTPVAVITGGCEGTSYVLQAVPGNGFNAQDATYQWTAGTGGQIIGSDAGSSVVVSGVATYSLTITYGGCSSTMPMSFTTTNTMCKIQKGISANGDGQNDYFDLEGQDVKRLQIFNRYGVAVYSRSNYSNQWYGQSNKGDELPDGTYYFVIERGSGDVETGWIYLTRERK